MLLSLLLIIFAGPDALSCATVIDPLDHAFYIAVIRLQHPNNSTEATIEFTIFSDDLESGLRAHNGSQSCSISELCKCSDDLRAYLIEKTNIEINQSECELRYVSCEQVGDTHKVLFSFDSAPTWTTLDVKCTVLMELFPTQNQMIYVHSGASRTTARLTAKKPSATISLR